MSGFVVIGGGIVGASAAFHLAQAGLKPTLVTSQTAGEATPAGAGIVAPGTSLRPLPAFFELAGPAVAYYPRLVNTLAELGIANSSYEVCGKLIVADTEEKAVRHPELKQLFEQRRDSGMPNIGDVSVITPSEARDLLPPLGQVHAAMYIDGAARVDGTRMRDALIAGAQTLGATVIEGKATLILEGHHVAAVLVSHTRIDAETVVIAAGAWSNMLLGDTGFRLPLAPQKGQIIHLEMTGADTTNWPILDWTSSLYQVSFGPNRVVCGATREFGSGFDTLPTAGGIKAILDEHLRLCPGLGNAHLAEVRVGLRPYSDDVLPFIGPLPGFRNIIVSTGHGPTGLQTGPYSGLLAAELAQNLQPSCDIGAFRLDRPIEKVEIP